MSKKCVACGQQLPEVPTGRLKVNRREIQRCHSIDGALVWVADGEEGARVGQDSAYSITQLRLRLKQPDNDLDKMYFAVELAARILAEQYDASIEQGAYVWPHKVTKKMICNLADQLLAGNKE